MFRFYCFVSARVSHVTVCVQYGPMSNKRTRKNLMTISVCVFLSQGKGACYDTVSVVIPDVTMR